MEQPPLGRRIAVVGVCGSGKSFVACALARRLGIDYVSNDAIIWGPQWTPTPAELRLERFTHALAGDAWTFDGNLGSLRTPEHRHILGRADTLVWLDLPRFTTLRRLLGRTVRRAWTCEELWHGNRETWRRSFLSRESILLWGLRTYARRRRQYGELFADPALGSMARIRLGSAREVDRWLAGVGAPDRA